MIAKPSREELVEMFRRTKNPPPRPRAVRWRGHDGAHNSRIRHIVLVGEMLLVAIVVALITTWTWREAVTSANARAETAQVKIAELQAFKDRVQLSEAARVEELRNYLTLVTRLDEGSEEAIEAVARIARVAIDLRHVEDDLEFLESFRTEVERIAALME